MNTTPMQVKSDGMDVAVRFAWREADLLDHRDYGAWLGLWADDGLYIVPIKNDAETLEDELNYIYDDDQMRRARVDRLRSKQSMSAVSAASTVRTCSRFVILEAAAGRLTFRCAQHLVETKRGVDRLYAADVTYDLVEVGGGYKLARKVVRLLNATDALGGIAYLL